MLKKLRRRFVAVAMAIICGVLVTFYLLSCSALFIALTADVRSVLRSYSNSSVSTVIPDIGSRDEDDSILSFHSGNVCVVEVKELGSIAILDFSRANMDEAILSRAVTYVLKSDYTFGHVSELNLFYNKTDIMGGSRIAFSDSTQYFSYLKTVLIDGVVLITISAMFLWIIIRFLANVCLKPVERAWEQQKNFIADASHELKTPLTVILTNSGILKSHPDGQVAEQMQWIDSTYEEASHMKELVEKLLLLAKTDNMSRKNMFTDVNFSEIAMQLSLQYEPVAFEKGVMLYSDIDKDIHINGDSVALNQIIQILLDNAIKYSGDEGEVTLSLKKRQYYSFGKKSAGYVYLTTRNTGTPIPEEDIPHLFERFYRSDKARTAGSGYGLGLAICKNLAQLHNAEISVTSDIEHGTVFTVKFKL